MDISRFDFELDELCGLIPRLAGFAQIIELEPRFHDAVDDVGSPAAPTKSTYRIICQLDGSEGTVQKLAELAAETGVEALFGFGRSVRLRHLGAGAQSSVSEGS